MALSINHSFKAGLLALCFAAPACADAPATAAKAAASAAASAATPEYHGLTLYRPEDAKFMAAPGIPACATMVGLRGDPRKEAATFLVKMGPGCIVPYHWHTPTEEIVILKGTTIAQMKGDMPTELKTGAYSGLPSKHTHRFRCSNDGECIIFVVADAAFDIHFVDEAGKALGVEEALKASAAAGSAKW